MHSKASTAPKQDNKKTQKTQHLTENARCTPKTLINTGIYPISNRADGRMFSLIILNNFYFVLLVHWECRALMFEVNSVKNLQCYRQKFAD